MKLTPATFAKLYLTISHGKSGVGLHEVAKKFWEYVWRKHFWKVRKQIMTEVALQWNKTQGVVVAQVESPRPLEAKVRNALEKSLGGNVEFSERTKPHLLAGLVVTVGDKRYDASLKGRLDTLEQTLSGSHT